MAIAFTINGTSRLSNLQRPSGGGQAFEIDWSLGSRATLRCRVEDDDSTASAYRPTVGQSIVLSDGSTTLFSGTILSLHDLPVIAPAKGTLVEIDAVDKTEVLDRTRINRSFSSGQTLKQVLQSIFSTELSGSSLSLDASQANGPTLGDLTFDNVTLTDAFNQLSTITSYVWRGKPDGTVRFFTIGTLTASYSLTSSNKKDVGGVSWTQTRGAYANRVRLKFGTATQVDKTDTFTTTTGQTSWALTYKIATATGRGYIIENTGSGDVQRLVSRYGVDAAPPGGYQIDKATSTLHRTSAPTAGTVITITYPAQFPDEVTVNDTALQATDGIYAAEYSNEAIFDLSQATDYANGLLARDKTTPKIVEVSTREGMVYPGDTITLTYTARTISGSYLITGLSITDDIDGRPKYRLTCASGTQAPGAWLDFWRGVTGGTSTAGGSVSGSLIPNLSGSFDGPVTANAGDPKYTAILGDDNNGQVSGAAVLLGGDDGTGDVTWSIISDYLQAANDIRRIALYPRTDGVVDFAAILTQAFTPSAGVYYLLPDGNNGGELHLGGTASVTGYGANHEITSITTLDTSSFNGYKERGRTTAMGEWIDVAFSAGNFTAAGSMTWTVGSGDQACYSYTLIGKTMTLSVIVNTSSVGGTLSNSLRVAIPGGFTVASGFRATVGCRVIQGATNEIGFITAGSGSAFVEIGRPGAVNFVSSTDTTAVQGTITFKVA